MSALEHGMRLGLTSCVPAVAVLSPSTTSEPSFCGEEYNLDLLLYYYYIMLKLYYIALLY